MSKKPSLLVAAIALLAAVLSPGLVLADTVDGGGDVTIFGDRGYWNLGQGYTLPQGWWSFGVYYNHWDRRVQGEPLIDDPLWVLSSVVILEAVPSEKSGVLVTGDPNSGAPGRMLVATSEGVGGAVDGTSAETVLWSPEGVQLITLFKSPWRNQLQPGGGTAIVPASGSETVLSPAELQAIVGAGQKVTETFTPVKDPNGRDRPSLPTTCSSSHAAPSSSWSGTRGTVSTYATCDPSGAIAAAVTARSRET